MGRPIILRSQTNNSLVNFIIFGNKAHFDIHIPSTLTKLLSFSAVLCWRHHRSSRALYRFCETTFSKHPRHLLETFEPRVLL